MVFYNNVIAGAAGAGGGDFTIQRSLRFNDGDTAHCSRTPSSAGNRKTMTWSLWVKRGDLAIEANIFTVDDGSSNTAAAIRFDTDGKMKITDGVGGEINTDRKFRDASAWYHLVIAFDTTQATASNRLRLYVNGAQVTSLAGTPSYPTQNADTDFNTIQAHYIGRQVHNTANKFDGYLAEVHFVDGQALDHTDFGEFDTNGVWNPKEFAGSYGGNGYYLKFADNSTAAALGTDSSGNDNTWTILNISVAAGSGNDSLIDTPTDYTADSGNNGGNYCILNPLSNVSQILKNGNLETSGVTGRCTGTIYVSSGKYYWEVEAGSTYTMTGIESTENTYTAYPGGSAEQYALYGDGNLYHNGSVTTYTAFNAGDILGFLLDMDAGELRIRINNTAINSGNAVATGLTGKAWTANCRSGSGSYDGDSVFNFGQRPFAYTPPTGYKSLCTTNLPDPTIADGSTAMDAKLYTGNGSTQSISGFNFQPEFVWIKSRSSAGHHSLNDSVRGAGKVLYSNLTNAENTSSTMLTAFNSTGFSVGSDNDVNKNNDSFVSWAWDGGNLATNSAYNQSQTWSSGMKTTTAATTTYSTTGRTTTFPAGTNETPFNGDLTDFLYSTTGVSGTWWFLEFANALTNVTSIEFNTEYSCPGGVIKLNGTDVAVNQSNIEAGYVTVNVTGTTPSSLTEIAVQGYSGSARLKWVKINGKYLFDPGVVPAGS